MFCAKVRKTAGARRCYIAELLAFKVLTNFEPKLFHFYVILATLAIFTHMGHVSHTFSTRSRVRVKLTGR